MYWAKRWLEVPASPADFFPFRSFQEWIPDWSLARTSKPPKEYLYGLSTGYKRSKIKGLTMAKGLYYRTNLMGKGIGFLINKNEPGLQKKINKELAKLQKNGTLSKIMIKYYGHDLTKKPSGMNVKYFKVPNSIKGE